MWSTTSIILLTQAAIFVAGVPQNSLEAPPNRSANTKQTIPITMTPVVMIIIVDTIITAMAGCVAIKK